MHTGIAHSGAGHRSRRTHHPLTIAGSVSILASKAAERTGLRWQLAVQAIHSCQISTCLRGHPPPLAHSVLTLPSRWAHLASVPGQALRALCSVVFSQCTHLGEKGSASHLHSPPECTPPGILVTCDNSFHARLWEAGRRLKGFLLNMRQFSRGIKASGATPVCPMSPSCQRGRAERVTLGLGTGKTTEATPCPWQTGR